MNEFVLVYDVRAVPLWNPASLTPLLLLPIMWTVARVRGARVHAGAEPASTNPLDNPRVLRALAVLILLVTGFDAYVHYDSVQTLSGRLNRGEYTRVEGRVAGFVPGDREGHHDERFEVHSGGQVFRYRYSWSRWAPGFHRSAGRVYEGARVRIADVNGKIARLEIQPAEERREGR